MRALVLGAAGYTGRTVTRALVARGAAVRGFVRRPEAEAEVRADGADEVVVGDLRDLGAVTAAAGGVDGLWFIGPRFMPDQAEVGKAIIDVAVRAGVPRFVLSGVYHPTIRALTNHQTKRHIEAHLYATDLEFVVLQPARYMHGLLLSTWQRLLDDGVLADSFSPDARIAYVDFRDVAEVAAIALTEDTLVRGTFELAAAGQPTLHELAAACAAELGRDVVAERVGLEDYAQAASMLNDPYSADGFARLRAYYDAYGFHGGNPLVLAAILGRAPTSFAGCMRAMLDAQTPATS